MPDLYGNVPFDYTDPSVQATVLFHSPSTGQSYSIIFSLELFKSELIVYVYPGQTVTVDLVPLLWISADAVMSINLYPRVSWLTLDVNIRSVSGTVPNDGAPSVNITIHAMTELASRKRAAGRLFARAPKEGYTANVILYVVAASSAQSSLASARGLGPSDSRSIGNTSPVPISNRVTQLVTQSVVAPSASGITQPQSSASPQPVSNSVVPPRRSSFAATWGNTTMTQRDASTVEPLSVPQSTANVETTAPVSALPTKGVSPTVTVTGSSASVSEIHSGVIILLSSPISQPSLSLPQSPSSGGSRLSDSNPQSTAPASQTASSGSSPLPSLKPQSTAPVLRTTSGDLFLPPVSITQGSSIASPSTTRIGSASVAVATSQPLIVSSQQTTAVANAGVSTSLTAPTNSIVKSDSSLKSQRSASSSAAFAQLQTSASANNASPQGQSSRVDSASPAASSPSVQRQSTAASTTEQRSGNGRSNSLLPSSAGNLLSADLASPSSTPVTSQLFSLIQSAQTAATFEPSVSPSLSSTTQGRLEASGLFVTSSGSRILSQVTSGSPPVSSAAGGSAVSSQPSAAPRSQTPGSIALSAPGISTGASPRLPSISLELSSSSSGSQSQFFNPVSPTSQLVFSAQSQASNGSPRSFSSATRATAADKETLAPTSAATSSQVSIAQVDSASLSSTYTSNASPAPSSAQTSSGLPRSEAASGTTLAGSTSLGSTLQSSGISPIPDRASSTSVAGIFPSGDSSAPSTPAQTSGLASTLEVKGQALASSTLPSFTGLSTSVPVSSPGILATSDVSRVALGSSSVALSSASASSNSPSKDTELQSSQFVSSTYAPSPASLLPASAGSGPSSTSSAQPSSVDGSSKPPLPTQGSTNAAPVIIPSQSTSQSTSTQSDHLSQQSQTTTGGPSAPTSVSQDTSSSVISSSFEGLAASTSSLQIPSSGILTSLSRSSQPTSSISGTAFADLSLASTSSTNSRSDNEAFLTTSSSPFSLQSSMPLSSRAQSESTGSVPYEYSTTRSSNLATQASVYGTLQTSQSSSSEIASGTASQTTSSLFHSNFLGSTLGVSSAVSVVSSLSSQASSTITQNSRPSSDAGTLQYSSRLTTSYGLSGFAALTSNSASESQSSQTSRAEFAQFVSTSSVSGSFMPSSSLSSSGGNVTPRSFSSESRTSRLSTPTLNSSPTEKFFSTSAQSVSATYSSEAIVTSNPAASSSTAPVASTREPPTRSSSRTLASHSPLPTVFILTQGEVFTLGLLPYLDNPIDVLLGTISSSSVNWINSNILGGAPFLIAIVPGDYSPETITVNVNVQTTDGATYTITFTLIIIGQFSSSTVASSIQATSSQITNNQALSSEISSSSRARFQPFTSPSVSRTTSSQLLEPSGNPSIFPSLGSTRLSSIGSATSSSLVQTGISTQSPITTLSSQTSATSSTRAQRSLEGKSALVIESLSISISSSSSQEDSTLSSITSSLQPSTSVFLHIPVSSARAQTSASQTSSDATQSPVPTSFWSTSLSSSSSSTETIHISQTSSSLVLSPRSPVSSSTLDSTSVSTDMSSTSSYTSSSVPSSIITSTISATPTPTSCLTAGVQWVYYYYGGQGAPWFGGDGETWDPTWFKTSGITPDIIDSTLSPLGFEGVCLDYRLIDFYGRLAPCTFFAIDYIGYVYAYQSGSFTFTLDVPDDHAFLWLEEKAFSAWDLSNTDINIQEADTDPKSFSYNATQGEYIPYRIHYGQRVRPYTFAAGLVGPDGAILMGNTTETSPYLVHYSSCDCTPSPELSDEL